MWVISSSCGSCPTTLLLPMTSDSYLCVPYHNSPSKGKSKCYRHLYSHFSSAMWALWCCPRALCSKSSERRISPLYRICGKVTLDIILTSVKEEIPFSHSKMNLHLHLSTAKTAKLNGCKWRQERRVSSLKYFMSEKPTTRGFTVATNFLKVGTSISLQNENTSMKRYYSAHSRTTGPKDT